MNQNPTDGSQSADIFTALQKKAEKDAPALTNRVHSLKERFAIALDLMHYLAMDLSFEEAEESLLSFVESRAKNRACTSNSLHWVAVSTYVDDLFRFLDENFQEPSTYPSAADITRCPSYDKGALTFRITPDSLPKKNVHLPEKYKRANLIWNLPILQEQPDERDTKEEGNI